MFCELSYCYSFLTELCLKLTLISLVQEKIFFPVVVGLVAQICLSFFLMSCNFPVFDFFLAASGNCDDFISQILKIRKEMSSTNFCDLNMLQLLSVKKKERKKERKIPEFSHSQNTNYYYYIC